MRYPRIKAGGFDGLFFGHDYNASSEYIFDCEHILFSDSPVPETDYCAAYHKTSSLLLMEIEP